MEFLRQKQRRAGNVDRSVVAAGWPKFGAPLGLAVLCIVAWRPSFGATGEPGPEVIRVLIPRDMATENLLIGLRVEREGPRISGGAQGQKGVWQYDIHCRGPGPARLFAYLPGYRFAQTNGLQPGASWAPAFEEAKTSELRGTLTDSKGVPLPGRSIEMMYHMSEYMLFAGYIDGPAPMVVVAVARTGDDGRFRFAVPRIDQDAFLREYAMGTGERRLCLKSHSCGVSPLGEWVFRPPEIPARNEYPEHTAIRLLKKAKVQGRIAPEFLQRHGITGEVRGGPWPEADRGFRIDMWASLVGVRSSHNCDLKPDLTFSTLLPPGQYDLRLLEWARGEVMARKIIPVKEDLTLEDGEELNLQVE